MLLTIQIPRPNPIPISQHFSSSLAMQSKKKSADIEEQIDETTENGNVGIINAVKIGKQNMLGELN